MTQISVVAAIMSALTLHFSGAIQANSPATVSPSLVLEPLAQTFASPREVGVWVIIENAGQDCRAVMLDQTVAAFPSTSRPYTFLTFELRDSQGRLVEMEHQHSGLRAKFSPADLLTLRCVSRYGWMIPLGAGPWTYPLRPGKYSLRAQLRNAVRPFFDTNPAQLRRLAGATGMDQQRLKDLLTDFSIDSQDVSFEVANPTP